MAETEGYSPGGDAELYISATLALLLGLMFTALGVANLFGQLLGPKGKIFIFEMDQVTKLFVEESSDQPDNKNREEKINFPGDGGTAGNPKLLKIRGSSSPSWGCWRLPLLVL